MCQWLHCDAPAFSTDLDHDTPFNHSDPAAGGLTTAASMKAYCRHHHRMKHTGAWDEQHNPDRSIDLLSPTGHHYRTHASGYLDLLGVDPDQVIDPDDTTTQHRRTRAANKAAHIRTERRHQQANINARTTRPHQPAKRPPSDSPDDDDPPF